MSDRPPRENGGAAAPTKISNYVIEVVDFTNYLNERQLIAVSAVNAIIIVSIKREKLAKRFY